jgi:hypothetical protein
MSLILHLVLPSLSLKRSKRRLRLKNNQSRLKRLLLLKRSRLLMLKRRKSRRMKPNYSKRGRI